jgi:hypothetical protein
LTESAIAPVMSSDTVACTVRSPSATSCSSFIRRRIAAWFWSLVAFASSSLAWASRRIASASWRRASAPRVRLRESCSITREMLPAIASVKIEAATSSQNHGPCLPSPVAEIACSADSCWRSVFVVAEDGLLGGLGGGQVGQVVQEGRHHLLADLELRLDLFQLGAQVVLAQRRQAQLRVAVQQAVDGGAEGGGVAAHLERGFGADAARGQEFAGAARQALGQHHQRPSAASSRALPPRGALRAGFPRSAPAFPATGCRAASGSCRSRPARASS